MKRLTYIFLLLIIVFVGCDQGQKMLAPVIMDDIHVPVAEAPMPEEPMPTQGFRFERASNKDIILDTQAKLVKTFTIVGDNIFMCDKYGREVHVFDMNGAYKYKIEMPKEVRMKISGRRWEAKFAGFKPHEELLVVYLRVYHGLSSNGRSDMIYSEVFFRQIVDRFEYDKHVRHSFLNSRSYDNENIRLNVDEQTFTIDNTLYYLDVYGNYIETYHPDAISIPLGALDVNWAYQQPFWHKQSQTLYLMVNAYANTYHIVAFVQSGH